jgi:hypothetical protein
VMEILMANSTISWQMALNYNHYCEMRFAFSKYKDNLFVVDGEVLNQGGKQISISDALSNLSDIIYQYTPDDSVMKKKKEKNVCVELLEY